MEPNIPLPTDNIYKFYALFGLLLFIASMTSLVYLHKSTNDLIFEAAIAVEEIEAKESPSRVDLKKREMLEKRVEVALKDRDGFITAIKLIFVFSGLLVAVGFGWWQYVIQPKQDRLLELQIQKAEQDLKSPPRSAFRGPNK